ncbi:MAG: hypothetical protein ACP5QZ_00055 [Candidatus Sumerlaeaceae bacterium]
MRRLWREVQGAIACVILVVCYALSLQAAPESFPSTTGTLVLLGEKPRTQQAGKAPVTVAIAEVASATLPAMRIVDLTVDKETVQATMAHVPKALTHKPTAVVIFTGLSDKPSSGDDEALRTTLVALARTFTRADVEVFFVPAATFVGADVSANLRLAADDAAVHYIEPGTEIGGEPYHVVMEEVGKLLSARAAKAADTSRSSVVVATVAPPPSPAVATTGTTTVVAPPGSTPATIYMVAPPPLKRFDPRETPAARRRMGKVKRPDFEE